MSVREKGGREWKDGDERGETNNFSTEMTYVRGGDMWGGSPSAWEGESGEGKKERASR